MPRGGKRKGAGLKPRQKRYFKEREHESIGKLALAIGQRCETLWREANADCWKGEKRTSRHKKIVRQVAEKFGETESMVDLLWDDYRRLEAHLRADLDGDTPV